MNLLIVFFLAFVCTAGQMLNRVLRSRIPDEISQRLKTLSSDIIHILLDPEHNSFHQPNLHAVVSNFPTNLTEITHYYFNQGGKLLRPTVSLLMSDACNGSTYNTRFVLDFINNSS